MLEIQAVTELIQSELVNYNDSIKVHTDNITAFFAINNQGSSQSLEITKTVGFLRQWLKWKKITIEMVRVLGKQNVVADSLSRGKIAHNEWELDPRDWLRINDKIPNLEIDLMATPFNNKLEKFISPFDHPRETAVDAFMTDWNRWNRVYIFPPVALLPKVLLKLESFQGTADENN